MLEKPAAEEWGGGFGRTGWHPSWPHRWDKLCFASLPLQGTHRSIFFWVLGIFSRIAAQQVGEYLPPHNRWWETCRVAGEVPNCTKKDWVFFTFFSSHVTSSLHKTKIKEKHCTSRVTSHRLIVMIPMLMLLFGSTSVSTSGLKKGRADWHFSLLAGAVRGRKGAARD